MKKLLFVVLLGLAILSCSEQRSQIEVVNIDFSDYLTRNDLIKSGADAKEAVLLNSSDSSKSPRVSLLESLKLNSGYESFASENNNTSAKYTLLVNETGTVDKVLIEKSMGSKLDKLVAAEVAEWKFKPAVVGEASVKYKFDLEYDGTDYMVTVEQMPSPVGGMDAIAKLVDYPDEAKKKGIQGRVFVKAFVNEDGLVDSVNLMRGIGYGCDESALNAIKKVEFTPAFDNGVKVKAQVVVPILFRLH